MLLACNNSEDAECLEKSLLGLEGITCLPTCFNGAAVRESFAKFRIDVFLTDLFLPDIDVIALLDELSKRPVSSRPMVFGMSALTDERLLRLIGDKAVYFFTKPLDPHRVQMRVLEFTHIIRKNRSSKRPAADATTLYIASCIRDIGVPAHLKGYYYLRESVRLFALASEPENISITNDIYPAVAARFDTDSKLVEHAMRTAIEIAWTRGNLAAIDSYFGYTVNDHKGKPSNLEFVAMIAEHVRCHFQSK